MNQNQDLKLNIDLKNTEKVETPDGNYVVALDTYNRYGSSPILVDDNTLEGCNIIDLYKDYNLPYYDT